MPPGSHVPGDEWLLAGDTRRVSNEAKRVARDATASTPLRIGARAGYVANGFVHVLIGIIVLVVAFGGDGESDQAGAFAAIARAPLGVIALWVLAVALWALGSWHAANGLLARDPDGSSARKWGRRVSSWGQAVVFLALGVLAASVALGARPDADETAEETSRGLLALPGGPLVLGLVGLGIAVGGIVFVILGVRRSYRTKMSIPPGALGTAVNVLGVVGFIAKGIALTVVGVLLGVAAVTLDPDAAAGLDGAIETLLGAPFGPLLVGTVGAGFIAYGVFCGFRARYAKL